MPSLVPRLPPGAIDMVCPVDWAHPLNKGLAEWWIVLPGMASGGKLLSITSAVRGAHGTLTNGPTWGAGPNGFGALTFDGADDYVSCAGEGLKVLDGASRMTMAFVVTLASGSDQIDVGRGAFPNRYNCLGIGTTVYWTFENGSNSYPTTAHPGAGTTLVTAVFNGTLSGLDRLAVYYNGRPVSLSAGGSSPDATLSTLTVPFTIGRAENTSGTYYYSPGKYPSTWLYSRALSATEVFALYEQSLRGYPDTLRRLTRAAWSFGGGGGAGTYTGSGAPSTDATTCAGTGTFTAPVYTGSGAPSTEVATTAGSGTHTAPTYTGTGTPATDETTCAGTGTFTAPVYTATGALSSEVATSSGTGTHTAPTYTGTGSPATDAPTATGSGTFTAPVYTGSASLATDTATLAGSGTFTPPVYTGSGTPNTEVATVAGTGTHTAPPGTYTGTGSLACESATCAGTGAFTSAASLSPRIVADTVDFAYTQADTVEFAYVHADTIDFVYTIGPDYLE